MSSKISLTRSRILKAAWKLLEDGKGNAVRMSDIAKAAGISRQALYLHFPNRADLLVATTRYVDEIKNVDTRLAPSRAATSGTDRLSDFIAAWGNYIPEIYGVAKALMLMQETDPEAAAAWNGRMQAVRAGCQAAVRALKSDDTLAKDLTEKPATDILWTLLSVRNWEHLRLECGWSQAQYIKSTQRNAARLLVKQVN